MTVVMYDSIETADIPAGAQAAAGYVGGSWPDYFGIVARFPALHKTGRILSIAVNSGESAMCLDVETGDASPGEAPGWIDRMLALGVWRPCIYANRSTMPAVESAIGPGRRAKCRLWVADWTYSPHIPVGFDACQWTDKVAPNDDASLCFDSFFLSPTAPGQPTAPHDIAHAVLLYDQRTGNWSVHGSPGFPVERGVPHWASAELQFHQQTHKWRVRSMPFDAPPMGGR